MAAYYNENDPKTAAWLRELIKAKLIADGEVDTRSIVDVRPADLRGFVQCHFFAGIGGWSYALRLAGWDDDRDVWTGSCPCQPWSVAGKSEGADDPRHLWPAWQRLIEVARPPVIFGEQVASKDGLYWLDLVFVDLEAKGYAVGAFDLPAASVGAPHVRQRLWIVADADGWQSSDGDVQRSRGYLQRQEDPIVGTVADSNECHELRARTSGVQGDATADERWGCSVEADGGRASSDVANATSGRFGVNGSTPRPTGYADERQPNGELGHADGAGREARDNLAVGTEARSSQSAHPGFWGNAEWIRCIDGAERPIEPGTFPLASGIPNRVVKLRGYGNAIVPQVAAEVIAAYMEIADEGNQHRRGLRGDPGADRGQSGEASRPSIFYLYQFAGAGAATMRKPFEFCCNGDGRPIQPPSKVLCKECLEKLSQKFQDLGKVLFGDPQS